MSHDRGEDSGIVPRIRSVSHRPKWRTSHRFRNATDVKLECRPSAVSLNLREAKTRNQEQSHDRGLKPGILCVFARSLRCQRLERLNLPNTNPSSTPNWGSIFRRLDLANPNGATSNQRVDPFRLPVQWLESSWQQCGEVFVRSGDDVCGLDHRVGCPEDGCQSRAKYSGACVVCYPPASLPVP